MSLRFARVLFGVTASPFLLEGTLIQHAQSYLEHDPDFVHKLLESLHVDDLISGCNTFNETKQFFLKCKQGLATSSFNLKKFQANNSQLEKEVYDYTGDDKSLI